MATQQALNPAAELADAVSDYTYDPVGFAYFAYPWRAGDLAGVEGPRKFQLDVMDDIGRHLQNPETRHQPLLIAIASGHGIGKTGLLAMLSQWATSTCEDCRVNVTANTSTQLETKTSPEFGKWFRRSINADWFNVATYSIKVNDPQHEKSWRVDLVPWNINNPQAVAGTHNAGKRIVIIFDEASEIPTIVWETVSGALTDKGTEIIWIACGQRTRNDGSFFDCFGSQAHRWKTYEIDSRTVEGTNLELFKQWEEDYGEDSDFFRVRVRGLAPRASDVQFIDSERIRNAQDRIVPVAKDEALVAAVDFAWGGDDNNVIRFRKGRDAKSIPPIRIPGEKTRDAAIMTVKLADILSQTYNGERVHTLFADSAGIAGDVVSRLRRMGHSNVIEVNFMADSPDTKYANMRAFMWGRMKEWLMTGSIDSKDKLLASDLASPGYRQDSQMRVLLEKKDQIKKRIGRSPDDGDALALTFPYTVAPMTQKAKPQYAKPVSAWG
jgi:hypothetical protein